MRRCQCDRCDKSGPYKSGDCFLCWKFHNDPIYNAYWSGKRVAIPKRFSMDCISRGSETGEVVPCKVCGGKNKDVAVHHCSVHGRCVMENIGANLPDPPRWCRVCTDKVPLKINEEQSVSPTSVVLPNWSYGVTSVKQRRDNVLPRTLASLKAAGFGSPHLFVDGCDDSRSWHEEFGLPVTARGGSNVRVAGNWVLSMYELYYRNPQATYYAMFQDDFVTSPNLREYLERNPCPQPGYMNLYTFPKNQKLAPKSAHGGTVDGWFETVLVAKGLVDGREVRFNNGLGAVGLVFPREAVVELLGSKEMVERPQDVNRGHKAIDGGIVHVLNKAGFTEYCHSPSLVQHTGDVSSHGNRKFPYAESFRGEGFDLLDLLRDPSSARR